MTYTSLLCQSAREASHSVTAAVELRVVSANFGKTRVYNALGSEVWRRDKPPAERGFLAMGVPIRRVAIQAALRLRDEDPCCKHRLLCSPAGPALRS